MPGHVEGDDAELGEDLGIVHEAAVLPAIRAGGVQADEGDARAGLLDIETMRLALDGETEVAADRRLEVGIGTHRTPPAAAVWAEGRGNASNSLK